MSSMDKMIMSEMNKLNSNKNISDMLVHIIDVHVRDLLFIMRVEKGPVFRYFFTNQTARNIVGLTDITIGKTLQEVVPYKKAAELQSQYEKTFHSKKINQFSDKILLPDGTYAYGDTILTPILNEQNEVEFIVAITRDATRSVEELTLLKESEQRFRSMFDHNLDGICTIDFSGKIIDANEAVQIITGYSISDLINQNIFDLFMDKDEEKLIRLVKETENKLLSSSDQVTMMLKNKSKITLQVKTIPIMIDQRIQGLYILLRDITEQEDNVKKIEYMAYHDQLTNLLNRRALMADLLNEIDLGSKYGHEFALFYIDLDRFKHLNDTMGHVVGDEILQNVAKRLCDIRESNFSVYRQGGDEFVILLKKTTNHKATIFAQKILLQFAVPFIMNGDDYYLSPSIGISMYPSDGRDSESLIKNADGALYRVKERGKGHFQFYRSDLVHSNKNIILMESHLRKAIERNELVVYYQPQVNLISNEIVSFEALIRWNSQEFGFVSPADFIPLAEETGLIILIGEWVFDHVCAQMAEWKNKGYSIKPIAVNLSAKQFQQNDLVNVIESILLKHAIHPNMLEIEITEGAMQDTKETIHILTKLKELGVSISVDDFGTGYSSLNYLKQFPLNILKVDQSFVRDVLTDSKNAAITTTIIHLANSLGLEVIAEGIEEKAQVEFLLKVNCLKGQGYLFSKPIDANEIEQRFF